MTKMKAIVLDEFGPPEVLQPKELEKPEPKENEILVKVKVTSVNYGDLVARNFKAISPREFNMPYPLWLISKLYFGISKPRIKVLGAEFAGEIEAIGGKVSQFKAGEPVFGFLGQGMGAYAEYFCMPEDGAVTTKPANMSFEEAAVVPMGAIMALYLLGKANLSRGQKVLIIGASGSLGSAAVQIAKNLGAEITGVCSTPRVEFVRSLGADRVIDYTQEDFTQNGEVYDLIFDVLGRGSFSHLNNSLAQNGRYLYASFKMGQFFQMLWTSMVGTKKVICALAPGGKEDLVSVKELIEAGKIKAQIDKCFPLEQAAEAHRYVEEGHKKGHIAISVSQDGDD